MRQSEVLGSRLGWDLPNMPRTAQELLGWPAGEVDMLLSVLTPGVLDEGHWLSQGPLGHSPFSCLSEFLPSSTYMSQA